MAGISERERERESVACRRRRGVGGEVYYESESEWIVPQVSKL